MMYLDIDNFTSYTDKVGITVAKDIMNEVMKIVPKDSERVGGTDAVWVFTDEEKTMELVTKFLLQYDLTASFGIGDTRSDCIRQVFNSKKDQHRL